MSVVCISFDLDEKSSQKTTWASVLLATVTILCILIGFKIYRALLNGISDNIHLSNTNSSFSQRFSSTSFNIAIIGSAGYIGSRLLHHLQQEANWHVVGYDRIFPGGASHEIPDEDLRMYRVIIYLGGLSDFVMCRNRLEDITRENVDDIYNLAKRMLPFQRLIFASTAEIAEGSGSIPLDENSPVQSHRFDAFVASMMRREDILGKLTVESDAAPQIIGLRLGIVIGLSYSQRNDLAHMAFVCEAFQGGVLHITHPEASRALLCMEDLLRAVIVVIKRPKSAKRFDLFNLQSFSASISNIANTVAFYSGAHIHISDHSVLDDSAGFSLNTTKFQTTYDFSFKGDQDKIISRLISNISQLYLGRQSRSDNDSVPCVVCGSRIMHTVLDLHTQPLANDFRKQKDEAIHCERFPLRLVRCPKCYHTQLSYIVDRAYLFSHYVYQSGTSPSLEAYFEWVAEKVIHESGKANGTVLELASNDGSQLNQFAKRGWKTIGVDPANNLAELARANGHSVYVGFWGTDDFSGLPPPESLDAIIAQNVLAHVENPVQFLRACITVMSTKTKLYIQTSQCEMYETGQFDTVYHEHVSFFTAHSFKKIADLLGLKVIGFEITPIHGRSFLVTFQRIKSFDESVVTTFQIEHAPSLLLALEKERSLGMTDSWFYVKYEAQARSMRQWIFHQLTHLHTLGHIIVGYGAAAKGMVLLHTLLEMPNRSWEITYVVDNASLKQDTYCPGTSIPVLPTSELSKHNFGKPLTILVFAWNFWEEISKNIRKKTVEIGIKNVFAILPFPQQRLIKFNLNKISTLTKNSFKFLPTPFVFPPTRRPVLLLSHFFNEEILLPFWIRHHSCMFDMVILIDCGSTDRSLEIIRDEAPRSWKVVSTRNKVLSAHLIDEEVKDFEKMNPDAWKIAMSTSDFLVYPNLRELLAETEHTSDVMALRFRSLLMVGDDSIPFQRFTSLLSQRSQYASNIAYQKIQDTIIPYSRYVHRYPYAGYTDSRCSNTDDVWKWASVGFIAEYQYSPWPQLMKRESGIFIRTASNDLTIETRIEHKVNIEELKQNRESMKQMQHDDLRSFDTASDETGRIHRLWREMTNN